MKQLKTTIITTLILSSIYGWYPDYTVLATDFKLRNDFLLPTQMNSINLVGLGNHFKNIYSHPLDNVFLNPAYLNFGPKNYLYFDLAGEEFNSYDIMEYPSYGYDEIVSSDYRSSDYYWSPYREVENSVPREPIFRVVYLGQPFCELPLSIGFTAEYFYDQEKFYHNGSHRRMRCGLLCCHERIGSAVLWRMARQLWNADGLYQVRGLPKLRGGMQQRARAAKAREAI